MLKISFFVLVVGMLPAVVAAQTTDAPADSALRLSLEDAVTTAVSRNLGVEIQKLNYRASGHAARSAYGVFDWIAFSSLESAHQEQPISSTIFSPQSDRTVANLGVRQQIPTGGIYSIGFNNNKSTSNNPFTTVDPAYNSTVAFSLDQPLLRNFGVNINRRNINIARNNLGISREAFRTVLTNTVLAVEQAYYDLIFARQFLEVQQQSLFLARDQERITQIRIDVGASAPLDILQPRVAIATREEQVIIAEAQIRNAEDRLRQLMNLPMTEWDRPIVPTEPIRYTPLTVNVDTAVAAAIERRPEVQQARLGTESRRFDYSYTRNQVLPQLDLSVDYGFAGLGGNRIIRDDTGEPIGFVEGGYGDAFSQVSGFDFPSWSVGVNVGLPLTNVGARASATRARLEMESALADEERTQQGIAMEVRQAARDIDTAAKQIVATRTAREAAEQNVDAERKRFENGLTTNFNVLQIQQELSDARSREIAALVAYNKAVANYHRAVGDLLEVRNISVQEPERFTIPRDSLEDVRWLNFDSPARK
jgi:outer membrane protein